MVIEYTQRGVGETDTAALYVSLAFFVHSTLYLHFGRTRTNNNNPPMPFIWHASQITTLNGVQIFKCLLSANSSGPWSTILLLLFLCRIVLFARIRRHEAEGVKIGQRNSLSDFNCMLSANNRLAAAEVKMTFSPNSQQCR